MNQTSIIIQHTGQTQILQRDYFFETDLDSDEDDELDEDDEDEDDSVLSFFRFFMSSSSKSNSLLRFSRVLASSYIIKLSRKLILIALS
jgi:hypothetical protein